MIARPNLRWGIVVFAAGVGGCSPRALPAEEDPDVGESQGDETTSSATTGTDEAQTSEGTTTAETTESGSSTTSGDEEPDETWGNTFVGDLQVCFAADPAPEESFEPRSFSGRIVGIHNDGLNDVYPEPCRAVPLEYTIEIETDDRRWWVGFGASNSIDVPTFDVAIDDQVDVVVNYALDPVEEIEVGSGGLILHDAKGVVASLYGGDFQVDQPAGLTVTSGAVVGERPDPECGAYTHRELVFGYFDEHTTLAPGETSTLEVDGVPFDAVAIANVGKPDDWQGGNCDDDFRPHRWAFVRRGE